MHQYEYVWMTHRLPTLDPEAVNLGIQLDAERGRLPQGEWVCRALARAVEERRRRNAVLALADLLAPNAPAADVDRILDDIEGIARVETR
jgi:hypothetical protein